eukprot:CAMPEP_0168522844 /NCGR_PEP_ID=MMETSP0405-20121227/9589_1 /TAXON_ID=498012 /ORGANISM="Trichosphaerium sp, Strain Am-I-7 wt" /LENGTH=323 /DNA_ID=CAMNT_0008544523 /DNA_START=186 /DNA_END=1157 /DNA_ORIENTATION=+
MTYLMALDLIGFGSYPDMVQNSDVFQGIYAIAREMTLLFQFGIDIKKKKSMSIFLPGQSHFTFAQYVNNIAFLTLDIRSERTIKQILSKQTYEAIDAYLDSLKSKPIHHFFLVSPVPVIYNTLGAFVDKIVEKSKAEVADDLIDQWSSHHHKEERRFLVNKLFDFVRAQKNCRLSILSGDAHIAVHGVLSMAKTEDGEKITNNSTIVNNIVSSGIGSMPGVSNALIKQGLYVIGAYQVHKVSPLIKGALHKFKTGKTHIMRRNYATIEFDKKNGYDATWLAENHNKVEKYTVYIYPFTEGRREDVPWGSAETGKKKIKRERKE